MKVGEKLRELGLIKSRLNEIQGELVSAIFEDCPKLEVIKYSVEEEYNDHNYSTRVYLLGLNGVEWDDEDERNVRYLSDFNEEDPYYRAWLVEAKFTHEEFSSIMKALAQVETSYLSSFYELLRKDYIP